MKIKYKIFIYSVLYTPSLQETDIAEFDNNLFDSVKEAIKAIEEFPLKNDYNKNLYIRYLKGEKITILPYLEL